MQPLTSNWNIININKPVIHKKGLTRFVSKLDKITGACRCYVGTSKRATRVACVRNRGKNKYSAVGVSEIIQGNFNDLKNTLKNLGFTGIRMGAIKATL